MTTTHTVLARPPAEEPSIDHRAAPTRASLRLGGASMAIALLLVGLSAGFFYTYEGSVTLGLAEVDDVTYVTTFQAINDTIRNPLFGVVFFGAMPATVLALVTNWARSTTLRRVLLVGAPLLYLVLVAITFGGNVPLNRELAEVVGTDPGVAAAARAAFEDDWNLLNMLRTIAVVASFAALIGAASTSGPTSR